MSTAATVTPAPSSSESTRVRHSAAAVLAQYIQDLADGTA